MTACKGAFSQKTWGLSKLLANADKIWYDSESDESASEDTKVSAIIDATAFHPLSALLTKQAD
jgi:hypothetical protein